MLRARAERVGARLLREGVDLDVAARQVAVGGQLLDLRTPAALYTEVFLPLHGEHQAHNALLALGAVEALGGRALDGPLVEAAFADVTSPGRLEVVRSSPTVLVDAAHNAAGAEALATALGEAFDLRHLVGVVAIMADKDAEPLLAALEPVLAEIVVTRNSSERSADRRSSPSSPPTSSARTACTAPSASTRRSRWRSTSSSATTPWASARARASWSRARS